MFQGIVPRVSSGSVVSTNEPAKPGMNSSGRSMKFSTSLNVSAGGARLVDDQVRTLPLPSNEARPVAPSTTTTRSSPSPPVMVSTWVNAIGCKASRLQGARVGTVKRPDALARGSWPTTVTSRPTAWPMMFLTVPRRFVPRSRRCRAASKPVSSVDSVMPVMVIVASRRCCHGVDASLVSVAETVNAGDRTGPRAAACRSRTRRGDTEVEDHPLAGPEHRRHQRDAGVVVVAGPVADLVQEDGQ